MLNPQGAASASGSKLLSCTSCRQRKIKCNKVSPCNNCQKSGFSCLFPTRRTQAPRSRQHAREARDTELLRRVQRLESLVAKVNAVKAATDNREQPPTPEDELRDSAVLNDNAPRDADVDEHYAWFVKQQAGRVGYLSNDFWTGLGDEFDGLRQLLERPVESDEDESEDDSSPPADTKEVSPQFILQDPHSIADLKHAYPSDAQRLILFGIYLANVDPVCKILHKPTISLHLSRHNQLFDDSTHRYKFGSVEAICFAIYFAAVTSLSSQECIAQLGAERDVLLERYRCGTETALAQADFLNSMEIVTLQAFTIYTVSILHGIISALQASGLLCRCLLQNDDRYLKHSVISGTILAMTRHQADMQTQMAIRSHNKTRSSWALIALAIRIAQGLGLHRDGDVQAFGIFEAEMRRRLWWQLLVLDIRASEDRGSEPVISEGTFNTRMPHNLNDEDFGKNTQHELSDKTGLTEMSFCLITMYVCTAVRKLNFIPPTSEHNTMTLEQKERLVKQCVEKIESHYLSEYDPSAPRMWLVSMIGRLLMLRLWLVVKYPLQSRKSTPQEYSKVQNLQTVVAYLTLSDLIEESEVTSGFKWFFKTYVPWHALAVALAELCVGTQGPLADQAWTVIDKCYSKWSDRVADTKEGMLWRPVKRLFKRARTARQESQPSSGTRPDVETGLLDLALQDIDIVSGLPNLCLQGPPRSSYTSQNSDILDSQGQPLGLSGYLPDLPVDLNLFAPIEMPPMTAEQYSGPINWDDWNEFISDVNTNGTDLPSEMHYEWPI